MTLKLIILDRDGVINIDSKAYIKSPEEWLPISGSLDAIARLNQAGYKVAVASNQSGVGRGYFDRAMLEKIHTKMINALASVNGHLDAVFYCPHHPDDRCKCRKPAPALLVKACEYLNIDCIDAVMIGDSKRDLDAAHAIGAKAIFIDPDLKQYYPDVLTFRDLATAVTAIINNEISFSA